MVDSDFLDLWRQVIIITLLFWVFFQLGVKLFTQLLQLPLVQLALP